MILKMFIYLHEYLKWAESIIKIINVCIFLFYLIQVQSVIWVGCIYLFTVTCLWSYIYLCVAIFNGAFMIQKLCIGCVYSYARYLVLSFILDTIHIRKLGNLMTSQMLAAIDVQYLVDRVYCRDGLSYAVLA